MVMATVMEMINMVIMAVMMMFMVVMMTIVIAMMVKYLLPFDLQLVFQNEQFGSHLCYHRC